MQPVNLSNLGKVERWGQLELLALLGRAYYVEDFVETGDAEELAANGGSALRIVKSSRGRSQRSKGA